MTTTAPGGGPLPPEVGQKIRDRIAQRTGMRLSTIQVEVADNAVVIRGRVSRYYHKQLLLQAALDAAAFAGDVRVVFDVEVASTPSAWAGGEE